MKALALSLLLSLSVAAPALADPAKPAAPAVAKPSSIQPTADKPSDDAAAVIDETAINDATTPEARRALLIRCSGPPPRPAHVAKAEKPASDPVDISLDPNFK